MHWLNLAIAMLGLAGLLGGVAAVFWSSRSKGIIELLKSENSAYKESNGRIHEENSELKQSKATCDAELKIWRENVTQGPSIEKLIRETNKQHSDYMKALGKVTEGLTNLVNQQGELTKAIGALLVNKDK